MFKRLAVKSKARLMVVVTHDVMSLVLSLDSYRIACFDWRETFWVFAAAFNITVLSLWFVFCVWCVLNHSYRDHRLQCPDLKCRCRGVVVRPEWERCLGSTSKVRSQANIGQ